MFVPLLQAALDNCVVVVVGTKLDLVATGNRAVERADAVALAQELNAASTGKHEPYFETSSLTGDNVQAVFEYIFNNCLPQAGGDHSHSTVDLTNSPPKQKSCAC